MKSKMKMNASVLGQAVKDRVRRAKAIEKIERIFKEKNENLVKFKDKLSFVFGVFNVSSTGFVVGRYPQYMPLFFTIKFFLLVGLRAYIYRTKRWHYFLFDFCYFVNLLVLLYIYVLPSSQLLFVSCFCLSVGPLAWAIIAWRNSMVFHSVDKMTSIFIHISPPMVMYSLRWHYAAEQYNICGQPGAVIDGYPKPPNTTCDISLTYAYVVPLLVYAFWQIAYLIKVEVISKDKVIQRDYMTSYRWLVEKDPTSVVHTLSSKFFGDVHSKPKLLFIFLTLQLLYTILTLIPAYFFFYNFYLHTFFLMGVILVSIWNGACFYIEVFSRRYLASLAEAVEAKPAQAAELQSAVSTPEFVNKKDAPSSVENLLDLLQPEKAD